MDYVPRKEQKANMSNLHPSPFHTELFSYLLKDIEKRIQEEELGNEKEFVEYKTHLQEALSSKANYSFVEILENYQRLFSEKKSGILEKRIFDSLNIKDFHLKFSRGLPRLYKKDAPTQSYVKTEFSHIPTLKKLELERFSLPLCEDIPIPPNTKICLFTYMLSDGWGDLIASQEMKRILKKRFPNLTIQTIVCIPTRFSLRQCNLDKDTIIIPYKNQCPLSIFPKKALKALQDSSLILSAPTFYPYTEDLKKKLQPKKKNEKAPRMLCIGQYGFLESEWFHPKSGNYSMGLHFLEKGILTRKYVGKADFLSLENRSLLYSLFRTTTPKTIHKEKYLSSNKLYLAYLVSPIGGAIYLHALLQSQIREDKTIDICTPDIRWLVEYIQMQKKGNRPLLEGNFHVREIEIHFQGKIHRHPIAKEGKKVRILCPKNLSDGDFRLLVHLSEEFIGIRGDQSFSEAVSVNRVFFYDGAPHARYFIKDLLALAENRLSDNKSAISLFRAMGKAFLYNTSDEPSEWVEETYFQEKEPWLEIAKEIATALETPATVEGFKKFNQIVTSEYSFNKTLCHLVQREYG